MDRSATFGRSLAPHTKTKMKTKVLGLCFAAAACVLLAACASGPAVSVATDYNHQISFAGYRTYALDLSQAPELQPTGRTALTDALKASLAERGITEARSGKADLLVVPAAITSQKQHAVPNGTTTIVPSQGGNVRSGSWHMNYDVTHYTVGTLVLDFLDQKRRLIVFRGVGQGALSSAERNAVGIQEAVRKIVAEIPR